MYKVITLAIIPALSGFLVYQGLSSVISFHQALNMDQLTTQREYNTIFAVFSFLFGVVPCLIYGLANNWMINNAPAPVFEPETAEQYVIISEPVIYVGMVVSVPAAGCVVRVKSINVNYQNYTL